MSPSPDLPTFCSFCGNQLGSLTQTEGNLQRLVCGNCGNVKYDNPKVLVACVATWGEKVLWIKRGNNPRKGYWAVPAGFMEMGETPEEAVTRELFEETRASISPSSLALFMVGSLPDISEVHLIYRAQLLAPEYECTEEAIDIALLDEVSAPWEHSAYPDVAEVMRTFYKDHAKRLYGIYHAQYREGSLHFSLIGHSTSAGT